jgi:nicotinamide-nucleotide amidase
VPAEMREIVLGTVLPDLRRRAGRAAVIGSRMLRTWGLSESGLAEILATRIDELDRLGNPTLAFQASGIDGIKVRIVAKCDDGATARGVLDAEESLIRGLLGDVVFGHRRPNHGGRRPGPAAPQGLDAGSARLPRSHW